MTTTTPETWGIGIVSNPTPTLCAVKVTEAGELRYTRIRKWTGKWDDNSKPIYRGHEQVVESLNPHQHGGVYHARSARLIDGTPRTLDEAMEICGRCPKPAPMSYDLIGKDGVELAKAQIAAALPAKTAG